MYALSVSTLQKPARSEQGSPPLRTPPQEQQSLQRAHLAEQHLHAPLQQQWAAAPSVNEQQPHQGGEHVGGANNLRSRCSGDRTWRETDQAVANWKASCWSEQTQQLSRTPAGRTTVLSSAAELSLRDSNMTGAAGWRAGPGGQHAGPPAASAEHSKPRNPCGSRSFRALHESWFASKPRPLTVEDDGVDARQLLQGRQGAAHDGHGQVLPLEQVAPALRAGPGWEVGRG